MEAKTVIPLSEASEGQVVSVENIAAGRGLRARLTSMGIVPRTKIRVVQRENSGPLVISVRNVRVALGRGVADKIMVI